MTRAKDCAAQPFQTFPYMLSLPCQSQSACESLRMRGQPVDEKLLRLSGIVGLGSPCKVWITKTAHDAALGLAHSPGEHVVERRGKAVDERTHV